jgi:hypothetical protein
MSFNEITPSTNLVLGSITTSCSTPEDDTWSVKFVVKEIVLVSVKLKYKLAPDVSNTHASPKLVPGIDNSSRTSSKVLLCEQVWPCLWPFTWYCTSKT